VGDIANEIINPIHGIESANAMSPINIHKKAFMFFSSVIFFLFFSLARHFLFLAAFLFFFELLFLAFSTGGVVSIELEGDLFLFFFLILIDVFQWSN